jgi:tetratricopeptide (TPR) repeat protein
MKPSTALILFFALLTTAGCLSIAGDTPAYPLLVPGGVPNDTHVNVSPGRSVIGISVKADEISTSSTDAKELFIQGLSHISQYNRFEEALECLNTSLEIDPEFTEAWCARGVALYNLQRYEEAQYSFDRALVLEPFNISVWFLKSITFYDMVRHSIG